MVISHPDTNLSKLYWPGEYVAPAGDPEGGADRMKMEPHANPDPGQARDNRTMPDDRLGDRAEGYGMDNMMLLLPSLPNLNAHPQKGDHQHNILIVCRIGGYLKCICLNMVLCHCTQVS